MSRAIYSHSRAHSPTFLSLHLRQNSFSNPSVTLPTSQVCSFSNLSDASPTSQLILQPFRRFTYVTAHSPTLLFLHLRHSSFSNPSFASPTSQALHLILLASRPCFECTHFACSTVYFYVCFPHYYFFFLTTYVSFSNCNFIFSCLHNFTTALHKWHM